jgi:hypothetical protein
VRMAVALPKLRGCARPGGQDHEKLSRSGGAWNYYGYGVGGCCR